jgi:uncharacterized damage-inducible protein DinB
MASTAAALKAQFDFHTRLFNNVLDGISDNEANSRNNEHVNHIKWVAGHLLNTRLEGMNRLTGGEADTTYAEKFARNSVLDPTGASYPPLSEIVSKWNEVSPDISGRINKLPEELLDSPAPAQSPIHDETFRGLMAFLVSHEAYHVGQLGILRKLAGKDAMSYR